MLCRPHTDLRLAFDAVSVEHGLADFLYYSLVKAASLSTLPAARTPHVYRSLL